MAIRAGISSLIYFTVLFGTAVMGFTWGLAHEITQDIGMTKSSQLKLLKEVVAVKPGLDNKKWDLIVCKLNPLMFGKSRLAGRNFFYDGDACASYFRSSLLYPHLNRKRSGKGLLDELEPFIAKAAESYQEGVNAYWEQMQN